MRKRHFVILVAVLYVMTFGVLNAEARPSVRVTHISKSKLGIGVKGVGGFSYNAKLNRWEGVAGLTYDGVDISGKPVIFKPALIGKEKVPAYMDAGNMMADPCDRTYIIITDKSYAIAISTDCSGDSFERLDKYAKTFKLPNGVHAIRAKEVKGWTVIE